MQLEQLTDHGTGSTQKGLLLEQLMDGMRKLYQKLNQKAEKHLISKLQQDEILC